ncbi:MAG: hypothetical protein Q8P59_14655 [Dehalococcoidia bacterium]|nr:hypothetical protein [Dehalococcoidia bacterium]
MGKRRPEYVMRISPPKDREIRVLDHEAIAKALGARTVSFQDLPESIQTAYVMDPWRPWKKEEKTLAPLL